jgi:hypothetical protein
VTNFSTEPSEVFRQLTARAQAIRGQLAEADRYDRRRLLAELNAATDAISKTPEGRYLEDARQVEAEATQGRLHAEYATRGRSGVAVLSLNREAAEFATVDQAIDDIGLASSVVDQLDPRDLADALITVVADLRQVTAAQLVRGLRRIADDIEHDGLLLSLELIRLRPDEDLSQWLVEETVDGDIRHSVWPPGWWRKDDDPQKPAIASRR